MKRIIAITGATGNIGRALVEALLNDRRVTVRAIGRSPKRLAPLQARGAELHVGDLDDGAFLTTALKGTDAVFAMIPPHYAAPDVRAGQRRIGDTLCAALTATRPQHVVALSSVGAGLASGTGPIAGLHEFEEKLGAIGGIAVVALRPAFFMENHLASIGMIKGAGINGSALQADTPLAMIATRDIAAAAAKLLGAPAFSRFSTQELLGPRDYTMREATAILGAAIGKPELPYVAFSYPDFRKGLLGAGFSESAADAFVEMETAFNEGRIQTTVRRGPLNTTPTTLEQFSRDTFAPAFGA